MVILTLILQMFVSIPVIFLLLVCTTEFLQEVVALQCYSCPTHSTANDCKTTTTCQPHEVCMLRRTSNGNSVHYHSTCEDKQRCESTVQQVNAQLYTAVGRKRGMVHVETTNGDCIISCCTTDMCNNGCHPPPKHACHGHGIASFQNSCYVFVNHEMNFHQAKDYCETHNYHLVYVNSDAENTFLINNMKQFNRGPVQYWIGITDEISENKWRFVNDSSDVTYFDWSPGEPDGAQGVDGNSEADCAIFDPFLKFHWRDEACSAYQVSQPICESY